MLPIIYSRLFNTRHIEVFFPCPRKYTKIYFMRAHGHPSFIAANYKKAFCMYLRTHSHHDQRITLRLSLMSYLSGMSKSSFRHSSTATFYVCRIRMYFVSERIQRNVSFDMPDLFHIYELSITID